MTAPALVGDVALGDLIADSGPGHEAQQDDSSRWYTHPVTGARYLSVTHVTGKCTDKPWLAPWGAKIAAEYAVDFLADWQAARQAGGRDAAVKTITAAARRNREVKADIGKYVHKVIEALVLDQPYPGIPETLEGRWVEWEGDVFVLDTEWLDDLVTGFLNFCEDFQITRARTGVGSRFVASEATVASDEHKAAGTLDALVRFYWDDLLRLLDVKTGRLLGPEVLAQLGAYDAFRMLWLRDGRIVRKPSADGGALVLHIRPHYKRGYKVLVVGRDLLEAGWAWWQKCREQLAAAETVPDRFGRALYPPLPDGSQPPPMVEDLASWAGCSHVVRPLAEAGFEYMADVALLERADVLSIPQIGPKRADALAAVLAEHGLTFKGETLAGKAVA